MTIEPLKGGKYRIIQMHKGTRYRVTVDHKPTKFEAQKLIFEKIDQVPIIGPNLTFSEAAKAYIDSKSNVISPSTIRGYVRLCKYLDDREYKGFAGKRLCDIDAGTVQLLINRYAAGHAPKTVRNMHGFISAVLKTYNKGLILTTTLPQKKKIQVEIPEDDDVKKILESLRGTPYEVPIMLAACGLRRSEICALELSDFDFENCTVHVCKAKLRDEKNRWITVDRTKTPESTRTVFLPPAVCEAVKRQGFVHRMIPETIGKKLRAVEEVLGMPHYSLHKFRHYFASSAHAANVPEAYILEQGGWSSPHVMKSVYRHVLESNQKQFSQQAVSHLQNLISCENNFQNIRG